ncbi:hypothetical protein [Microseira sp. BLCC-F43]|uniref:hypothetical protein n=1 Tax=Microseira sp. BLCC-F43 TaxID=3153602 RepID=UPI0035B77C4B
MTAIAGYIEIAYQRNTSAAIRDLKQQLGELPTNRSTGKNSKICGANASAWLWHNASAWLWHIP